MSPPEHDNPPAISDLAKILADIKECEEFIAICERIKALEKAEENNVLPQRIFKLRTHITETMQEMKTAVDNVQRNESVLNSTNRTIGSYELEQLKELIKIGKARVKTLQIYIEEEEQQVRRFEQEMQRNAESLQQLYTRLEEAMNTGEMHPNTVKQQLEQLRSQEEKLRAERKANIALRNAQRDNLAKADSGTQSEPFKKANNWVDPKSQANLQEPAIQDAEFYQRFIEDISAAKKSVVIISKYLSVEQSGKIMPELAKLAAKRLNVLIYTSPPDEHSEAMKLESLSVISIAHRHMITVMQRPGIENNAAIIDDLIAWEGTVNILGPPSPQTSMHRVVGSSNARNLRKFISSKPV